MNRIRPIKSRELLHNEELFDSELASGQPLRLAFVGLFTVADRDGRFLWKPRSLKLQLLPYDEVDFEGILNALVSLGLVQRDDEWGQIISLKRKNGDEQN